MELSTQDYVKKALLDTQERVRDFMNYAEKVEDKNLQAFFRNYAEYEGHQARKLQAYLKTEQ